MTKVIIQNATWSGDEKSVDFSYKGNSKRYNVVVGNDNWEEENESACKEIIEREMQIEIENELVIM